MKPSDLALLRTPGVPTVSPDGRTAVVSLSRPDLDADQYTGQLWLLRTEGDAPPRQLTHGWRDSAPRISPDGRWLAFLRANREGVGSRAGGDRAEFDDRAQLCVMPLDGGEPRRLTDHPLGAGPPAWSPDSTRLAYAARVPDEGRYGTGKDASGERLAAEAEPPRRITRLFYRLDDVGFTLDRPRRIFVVTLDGAIDTVTTGEFDHGDPRWSPDGAWLTFAAARHDSYANDVAGDVWVIRPDGSGLRALTDTTLTPRQPWFTPDGTAVVFVGATAGPDRIDPTVRNDVVWMAPLSEGEVRPLLDVEAYNLAAPGGEIFVYEQGVLFLNEHRGAVQLVRVPFDGGPPDVLVDGERQVAAAAVGGGVVVTTIADPQTWGDVYAGERRLTDFSAGYRDAVPVLRQEELTATAPDGYPVHGWVVRPTGPGPHPVLLMIHGGPFTQYGWRLFDEAQAYAGGGYAVVMGNPRGSSGYGEAHGRAVMGDVPEASAVDLLALLDAGLKAPDLDGGRVGVLGGSHGGFMTTWLAAHHGSRFRAAISERAVNAIDSFVGASDIGWFFADSLYRDDFTRQSPLTYADRIGVPMLIIHSEHDWRCPLEQAQRLFVALKRRGAEVEMLIFPGEGHELSRNGRPSHRVARLEAILEWFSRYL